MAFSCGCLINYLPLMYKLADKYVIQGYFNKKGKKSRGPRYSRERTEKGWGGGGQAQVIELNRNLCKLCSRSIEKSRGSRYSRERTEGGGGVEGWGGGVKHL